MKPGTGVFGKLTDLYRRMGEAYATTAKAAGLSCDDCPHNCCTRIFSTIPISNGFTCIKG